MTCQMTIELYRTNLIKLMDSTSGRQVKSIPVYVNQKENLFFVGTPRTPGYKIMSR